MCGTYAPRQRRVHGPLLAMSVYCMGQRELYLPGLREKSCTFFRLRTTSAMRKLILRTIGHCAPNLR